MVTRINSSFRGEKRYSNILMLLLSPLALAVQGLN